jgi:Flp pilus assembly protein TadG
MKPQGRIGRMNRGNTAVEFALTLPVFMLLIVGIIEFGWLFFMQHTLQHATREGTRLALVGGQITAGGNVLSREDSIIRTIREKAPSAMDPNELQIAIYPVSAGFGDPANWQSTLDAGNPGDFMRVRTRYNHTFITPMIGGFFTGGDMLIQAESTYRNE